MFTGSEGVSDTLNQHERHSCLAALPHRPLEERLYADWPLVHAESTPSSAGNSACRRTLLQESQASSVMPMWVVRNQSRFASR